MIKIFLLIIVITCSSIFSFGQTETFYKRMATSPSQPLLIGDIETVTATPNFASYQNLLLNNNITLGIDHNYKEFIGTEFDLEVDILITPLSGTAFPTTLVIEFYPFKRQDYRDKDTYLFQNEESYTFEIMDIRVDGVSTTTMPSNVFIDGEIDVTRAYDFASNAATAVTINGPIINDLDCDGADDEIDLNWNTIIGAIEYQVEWTFVNDYDATVTATGSTIGTLSTSNMPYDFRHNATRITTTNTHYQIPLLFERGYLLYRVRAVGIDQINPDRYIYGTWGSYNSVTDSDNFGKVSDYATAYPNAKYKVVIGHEHEKNWQVTTTFAEEGKKKEVASYYDGSLRNRQSVTTVNSDDNIIVGETIYDHQGRPAVNILPVPVSGDNCSTGGENALKFYPNFNQNQANEGYSKDDFDVDVANCETATGSLNDAEGASKYYSPNNPNQEGEQGYVPDSKDHPFTVVEYTPDNTGRIRRQSGVGEEFKLGSGHESKYFYGKPDQLQLDRLFGSEVGDKEHYKKNMVIDPNGQISVSYLDQEGRVVATSLAGLAPSNLDAVESYQNAEVTLEDEMILPNENNTTSSGNINQIELSQSILVSTADIYNFTYDISADHFTDNCMVANICFSCVYDLTISITDDCGTPVEYNDGTSTSAPLEFTILEGHFEKDPNGEFVSFVTDCSQPNYQKIHSFDVPLEVGNYNLVKNLTINENAIRYYLDAYLDSVNNTCVSTLYDFQAGYLNEIDTMDCYIDCQICFDDIGDRDDFVAGGRGTAEDWDDLFAACDDACSEPTMCELAYEMMLIDVSPEGQYGKYLSSTGTTSPSSYPLSVLNTNNYLEPGASSWKNPKVMYNGSLSTHYLNDDGTVALVYLTEVSPGVYSPAIDVVTPGTSGGQPVVQPYQLTNIDDFINLWQDSWAISLVQYHPEYCYYEQCLGYEEEDINNVSSESFDAQLRNMSFTDAVNEGFISGNNASGYSVNIINNDPFVTFSTAVNYNIVLANSFANTLQNYQYIGGVPYSYEQIAALINKCGNASFGSSTVDPNCIIFGADIVGLTLVENDNIRETSWFSAVAFYLGKKNAIINAEMDQYAIDNGCFNDCIGSDDFNIYNKGFYGINDPFNLSFGNPVYDINQPCSFGRRYLYLNKQKRFPDVEMDLAFDQNELNYQMYAQTGLCPTAVNFEALLNEVSESGNLLNTVDLSIFSGYAGLVLALNDESIDNPLNQATLSLVGQTTSSLRLAVTSQNGNQCDIEFTEPNGATVNWANIIGFSGMFNVQEGSPFHTFEITAEVDNGNGSEFVELTGLTCIPLASCNFSDACTPNDLGQEIELLMSAIIADGNLTNTFVLGSQYAPVIGPQIELLLGTVPGLTWEFDDPNSLARLKNSTTNIELRFSQVEFEPGVGFVDMDYFDNINSLHQNYFELKGRNITGGLVVSIEGSAHYFSNGIYEDLELGTCETPNTAYCNDVEHQNLQDLQELLTVGLLNVPNAINLYASAELTSTLTGYMNPFVSSTTSSESVVADQTTNDNIVSLLIENGDCDFDLEMQTAHTNTFADIVIIDQLYASGEPFNNNYYQFTIDAQVMDVNGALQPVQIAGTSCIPLKNCEDCNDNFVIDVVANFDTLVVIGKAFIDSSLIKYRKIVIAIDDLNTREAFISGSTSFVEPITYLEFAQSDMDAFTDPYLKYLNDYSASIDDSIYLYDMNKFAIDNGNCINIDVEYERYLKAIDLYNDRAIANSLNTLIPVDKDFYSQQHLACHCNDYVEHLDSCLVNNMTEAQQTEPFYVAKGVITYAVITDPCKLLYEDYLTAFKYYVNNNQNLEYCRYYVKLVSFEDFKKNNLCYDATSLNFFQEYINEFYNLNTCPNPVPCYNIKTKMIFYKEDPCVQQWTLYAQILDDYNNSDYALQNSHSITITPYQKIEKYCECLSSYIDEMVPYLSNPANLSLPLPVAIQQFSCRPEPNPCDEAYNTYKQQVAIFNKFGSVQGQNWFVREDYKYQTFIELDLCNCVEGFLAYLQYVIDNDFNVPAPADGDLSIESYCAEKPCTPNLPQVDNVPDLSVPYVNPCVENMINIALANAENAYNEYVNDLSIDFIERYTEHCINSLSEGFTKEYKHREHHYTLYYYDQSGNLVKTVPPEGVAIVDITSSSDPLALQIVADRDNHEQTVFTNHTLATTYLYNSLNQLVKQSLPDHDKMDILDYTLINGLDSKLQIQEVNFISDNIGYLVGTKPVTLVNGDLITRGMMYTTNNGGNTWTRINNVVASDINGLQWSDVNTAYAVANHGVFIRSVDGGSSWDMIDLYAEQISNDLNDLYIKSDNTGLLVGDELTIVSYDGTTGQVVNTSPQIVSGSTPLLSTDNIVAIDYDVVNQTYYIVVNKVGNTSLTYSSTDGLNWTSMDAIKVSDLTALHMVDNQKAYAAGVNGLLISTTNQGDDWNVLQTDATENIEHIYFLDNNHGVAIINGGLYKSFNNGENWDILDNTVNYNNMHVYIEDYANNASKLIVAGDDGHLAKVIMQNGNIAMIPIEIPAAIANGDDLVDAYTSITGTFDKTVALTASGTIYYNNTISNPTSSWFTNLLPAGSYEDIVVKVAGNNWQGIVRTTSGSLHKFDKTGGFTTFPILSTITFSSISIDGSQQLYAYNNGSNAVTKITLNPGVSPGFVNSPVTGVTGNILLENAGTNLMAFFPTGENYVLDNTFTATEKTFNVRPQTANDIALTSTHKVVATDNGKTVNYNGTTGILNAAPYRDNFNGLSEFVGGEVAIIGDNGLSLTWNQTNYTNLSFGTTENLNSVDYNISCNCAVVVGDNGVKFYYDVSTSSATALNNTSSFSLMASAVNDNGTYTLGGENATMYFGAGTFNSANNQVFSGSMYDVDFKDINTGVIGGNDYLARRTTNGGATWNVIAPSTTDFSAYDGTIREIEMLDNTAIIGGANGYYATVTNNAITGINTTLPSAVYSRDIHDMEIAANGSGYMVGGAGTSGNGFAAKTTDYGQNWTLLGSGFATQNNLYVFENNNTFFSVGELGSTRYYDGISYSTQPTGISISLSDIQFYDNVIGYAVGEDGTVLKTSGVVWDNGADRKIVSMAWVPVDLTDNTNIQPTSIEKDINTIGIVNRNNIFLGGEYEPNSTAQNYGRVMHDESEEYSTYFWYDKLGRLVVSQNSRQYAETPRKYSYILFDALGRLVEAGEKLENTSANGFPTIFGATISSLYNPKVIDDTKLNVWIADATGVRQEVTHNYYGNSVAAFNLPASFIQNEDNLRKRIGSITYEDVYDADDATYDYASHYDYDIHGNIEALLQDNKKLGNNSNSDVAAMQYKRMDYTYDLISGNVHQVSYQDEEADQWYHRYEYDADNRITNVQTSLNKVHWEEDARYFYYDHGPLARTELGENNVQGCDYAYTLQGWLKGVNGDLLNAAYDIGKDGWDNGNPTNPNPNQLIAKDATGFSLNFFTDDYDAINPGVNTTQTSFYSDITGSDVALNRNDLHNGNIGSMVTTIKQPLLYSATQALTPNVLPQATAYYYDQLNRLLEARAFDNVEADVANTVDYNKWLLNMDPLDYDKRYFNKFEYDANGNIETQVRKDQSGAFIDDLSYNYAEINGKKVQNRLYSVNDMYDYDSEDIDDMGTFVAAFDQVNDGNNNYKYDPTGQLIQDTQEEIGEIVWRVDGKIKAIIRELGSLKSNLVFDYGPLGNRIAKHIYGNTNNTITLFDLDNPTDWEKTTYYNRDTRGNVMAIYEYKVDVANNLTNFTLAERNIYGSSRVGMSIEKVEMISPLTNTDHAYSNVGKKQYELSNHLGNVLTVISDRKYAIDATADGMVDYYEPDILLTYDYSPFGVILTERNFTKDVCHDTTYQQINYIIAEDFTATTLAWAEVGSTVATISGGELNLTKANGSGLFRIRRTVALQAAISYDFSFDVTQFGLGNNKGIECQIRDLTTNTIVYTSGFITGTGSFTTSFTASNSGNYQVSYFARKANGNTNGFNTSHSFSLDNIYLSHEVTIEDLVCVSYGDYRYGFNGMEKDDEVKGTGNSYNFKYRILDTRLGRFFTIDPISKNYPSLSTYQVANNNPIWNIESEGLEGTPFQIAYNKAMTHFLTGDGNKDKKINFGAFHAQFNTAFWHQVNLPDGQGILTPSRWIRINKDILPADAIADVWNNPELYQADCIQLGELCRLQAMRETMGNEDFNTYMAQSKVGLTLKDRGSTGLFKGYLFGIDSNTDWRAIDEFTDGSQQYGDKLDNSATELDIVNQLKVGDRATITNSDAATTDPFYNENFYKVEGGYSAHPMGDKLTFNQIKLKLSGYTYDDNAQEVIDGVTGTKRIETKQEYADRVISLSEIEKIPYQGN